MDDFDAPVIRPVVWMGNSKKNILEFPKEVQKLIGDELQLIQFGGMPKDAKPFKGVGSGVFEIAVRTIGRLTVVCRQFSSEKRSMYCTRSRKNLSGVLQHRNRM